MPKGFLLFYDFVVFQRTENKLKANKETHMQKIAWNVQRFICSLTIISRWQTNVQLIYAAQCVRMSKFSPKTANEFFFAEQHRRQQTYWLTRTQNTHTHTHTQTHFITTKKRVLMQSEQFMCIRQKHFFFGKCVHLKTH